MRSCSPRSTSSAGYNLRRLTRDQSVEAGRAIEPELARPRWGSRSMSGSPPEMSGSVRAHIANNGQIFAWDSPPPDTGHPGDDVQCRCVAVAVIPEAPKVTIQDAPPPPVVATPGDYVKPLRPGDRGWKGLAGGGFKTGPFKGVGRRLKPSALDDKMNDTWRRNPFTDEYTGMAFTRSADDLSQSSAAEITEGWAWLSERYPLPAAKVKTLHTNPQRFPQNAYAHTGSTAQIDDFAEAAARREKGFVRDRLAKEHDWTTGDSQKGMVGFNPTYYKTGGTRIADQNAWVVGDRLRAYGSSPVATVAQRRARTVVHEFGHQVGFSAFSRWAADEIIDHQKRTGRFYRALEKWRTGARKTRPRDVKPALKGWVRGHPDPLFAVSPDKGISSPVAEQRFVKMVEANREALGKPKNGALWKQRRGSDDWDYQPWSWWGDVSDYARTDIHEFTAESFTAVTLYGDDAPLVARLWVRELNKAIDAMEVETVAARAAGSG